jgi:hypothetical protein
MPASYLEIVQLENGEFALQRADGDGDSLVRISFSKEAQDVLQQNSAVVVRAMISAAIQTVSTLNGSSDGVVDEDDFAATSESVHHTVH